MADPSRSEPRNPFYLALLVVSLVFLGTAMAYAIVPTLEDRALEAGVSPPSSPFRAALRRDGWLWILWELAAVVALAIASMVLDRWRSLRVERLAAGAAPATKSANDAQL
jgi:hypothetical protein